MSKKGIIMFFIKSRPLLDRRPSLLKLTFVFSLRFQYMHLTAWFVSIFTSGIASTKASHKFWKPLGKPRFGPPSSSNDPGVKITSELKL